MQVRKCLLVAVCALSVAGLARAQEDPGLLDKGYRTVYRLYEDCQQRNSGVFSCLKKKALRFMERLGRIDSLPLSDNLELVKAPDAPDALVSASNASELEASLGRTNGASGDELLNEMLLERASALMNGFNMQIRLPKTSPGELKRSIEEGRGKMKKMMGMMMMGMAMKMAAMVPLAMGVLFLLAGKALIISKIALVLSMIIGLKKLLSQKQGGGGDHGHGWQSGGGGGGGGGGWDRSLKDAPLVDAASSGASSEDNREFAHGLAYAATAAASRQQRK